MDILNSHSIDPISGSAIMQCYNLEPVNTEPSINVNISEIIETREMVQFNYCPLPTYCLIEDKHKYSAELTK